MPTFKNLGQILKYIDVQKCKTLGDDVAKAVTVTNQENIEDTVYSYEAVVYDRRGRDGGLIADENIISTVKGDTLEVKNITPQNDNYAHSEAFVPGVVEFGGGAGYGDYDYYDPGARPFTQNTIEDLKTNKQHVIAMKSGLRKRGINVK